MAIFFSALCKASRAGAAPPHRPARLFAGAHALLGSRGCFYLQSPWDHSTKRFLQAGSCWAAPVMGSVILGDGVGSFPQHAPPVGPSHTRQEGTPTFVPGTPLNGGLRCVAMRPLACFCVKRFSPDPSLDWGTRGHLLGGSIKPCSEAGSGLQEGPSSACGEEKSIKNRYCGRGMMVV